MKYFSTASAITMTVAMGAATLAYADDDKYKLVLTSETGDRDSVLGQALQTWTTAIEEKPEGRMKVNVFYEGELGGQQEFFDQLVKGNVHMMITWPQTSYDQRIGVNYVPDMVMDWQDAIQSFCQEDPFPEGFGGVTTKGRFAPSFEEAEGLKVRSQPIFPLPQTIQAMGFHAVPIDWAEAYTSIQTGVVDGDSSNVIYWDYEYLRDPLDYFVQTSHNFLSSAQSIIDAQFASAKAEDDKWIAAAQEAGMEYIVSTREQKLAWVERVRADVCPQAEEALGKEIMDAIRANASVPK